jgi:ATP-binding protein involved in chromosome partitioning
MADITKSRVLKALKKVEDKNFNRDLLILNSIKKIDVKGKELTIEVELAIPASVIDESLKNKFSDALLGEFTEIDGINLKIDSKVTSHHDKRKEELLPGIKNSIAIASGKGGVGKSTVAVNIAAALVKEGYSVGLIDADIYGPSIPLMLGFHEKPQVFQDSKKMKLIPLEKYGIKFISIGVLVDDNAPVIWRGPMASGALKQFMTDVDWQQLDFLLFDMPPGTGDIQLTLVQTVPLSGAVIVTTPQEVSLIDARKALKMFQRVNVPVSGIVENMSYFIAPDTGKQYDIFGEGGGLKLAAELNTNFLGGIPIDPRIRIGGDKGIPIVHDMPDSDNAKSILEITRKLVEQVNLSNLNSSKVEISLDDDE